MQLLGNDLSFAERNKVSSINIFNHFCPARLLSRIYPQPSFYIYGHNCHLAPPHPLDERLEVRGVLVQVRRALHLQLGNLVDKRLVLQKKEENERSSVKRGRAY